MDWRTYSNGRRNRRNNRLDNRNRWIVAEEGQRSAKNTAIGHGLVQDFLCPVESPKSRRIMAVACLRKEKWLKDDDSARLKILFDLYQKMS